MFACRAEDLRQPIRGTVKYPGMVFEPFNCVQEALQLDELRNCIERADVLLDRGKKFQASRTRQRVPILRGVLTSQSSLGSLAVDGTGGSRGDEEQVAGEYRSRIVPCGGSSGWQLQSQFEKVLVRTHVRPGLVVTPNDE